MLILGLVAILTCTGLNVSAETDGTGDVWHWQGSGSSWSWDAYSGEKSNIDITTIEYSISGSDATLTMTVDGSIQSSASIFNYMHLTSPSGTYRAWYSAGVGMWVGSEGFAGETGMLTDPVTGNTFSATFPISDTSASYDVWAYAAEYATIGDVATSEWWADYAPAPYAPWYTADDDTGDDDDDDTGNGGGDGGKKKDSPGFELIALILLRRRK